VPTLHVPAALRGLTGGRASVATEARTVGELLRAVEQLHPGLRGRLLEAGDLAPGLAVAVDGEIASEGLEAALHPAAEVRLVPAIAGGGGRARLAPRPAR